MAEKVARLESDYLDFNPFDEGKGDYSIEFRYVKIVTTRVEHPCMASYLVYEDRKKGHSIKIGERAYCESAKVEGHVASCYSCLLCLDKLMDLNYL